MTDAGNSPTSDSTNHWSRGPPPHRDALASTDKTTRARTNHALITFIVTRKQQTLIDGHLAAPFHHDRVNSLRVVRVGIDHHSRRWAKTPSPSTTLRLTSDFRSDPYSYHITSHTRHPRIHHHSIVHDIPHIIEEIIVYTNTR